MTAFFSKFLAIFMTLISIIMLAKPDNVEISVKDMTTASTCIEYTCVNNTGRRIGRPDIVSLEKNVDGQWQEAEIFIGRTEEYYTVFPGNSCVDHIELYALSKDNTYTEHRLEPGEYKLTICYKIYGTSTQEGQTSTEFTVSQA